MPFLPEFTLTDVRFAAPLQRQHVTENANLLLARARVSTPGPKKFPADMAADGQVTKPWRKRSRDTVYRVRPERTHAYG